MADAIGAANVMRPRIAASLEPNIGFVVARRYADTDAELLDVAGLFGASAGTDDVRAAARGILETQVSWVLARTLVDALSPATRLADTI